jgi:hypothetical protein
MRKLVVLLAVLALCSTAHGVVISLEREGQSISMTPGQSISLYVASSGTLLGLDAIVSVEGDAIITAAMSPADCSVYGWDPGWPLPPVWMNPKSVEIGGANFGGNNMPIIGYVTIQYGSGTAVVSIAPSFGFGGSTDIYSDPAVISNGVVTLIPEPVTLALLGLGGLFLRRRK